MVLSFQKKLLEQVIDARHGTSLAQEEAFQRLYADKQRNVAGMLYLRMKDVPMGDGEDSVRWTLAVSDWMELDLKFAPDAIYCSGLCHDVGGGGGLADALQRQENISMNVGEALPSSTVLYQCWSMSDKDALFPLASKPGCLPADSSSYVAERDAEWLAWLEECAGDYALSCFFTPVDRQGQDTCAVVVVPLPDEAKARQRFYAWLHQVPRERQAPARPSFRPGYERYPRSQAYRKYLLPRNSFFARLTGIEGASLYAYACFYGDRLLLAADAFSLSAYVDAIERGEVLQDVPAFEEVAHTLAPSGTYFLMADLGRLAAWPGACRRWIPTFFDVRESLGRLNTLETDWLSIFSGVTMPGCWCYYARSLALLCPVAGVTVPGGGRYGDRQVGVCRSAGCLWGGEGRRAVSLNGRVFRITWQNLSYIVEKCDICTHESDRDHT